MWEKVEKTSQKKLLYETAYHSWFKKEGQKGQMQNNGVGKKRIGMFEQSTDVLFDRGGGLGRVQIILQT